MEIAIVLARIGQYLGGAVLFGAPLFLIYAFPGPRPLHADDRGWIRPLALGSAALTLVAAAVYLLAQTANMAGDLAAASDPGMLGSVLFESAMGWAVCARAVTAALALVAALVLRQGPAQNAILTLLGSVVLLSFAWTGHGAAQEGAAGLLHLAADLLHLLAAGVWIGALAAFAILLRKPPGAQTDIQALQGALARFSGVGSLLVAVLLASGLVNSWFLVGPTRLPAMFTSAYGQVLIAKLVLFAGMLWLAARNRFSHTPALAAALGSGETDRALGTLRTSVYVETALGFGVLALVGVLGMMAPIASE